MDNRQRTRILSMFRQRLFMTLLLKKTVTFAAVFFLLWGVAVLALRVGGLQEWKVFALSFLTFLVVPLFAWLDARRLVPDDRKLGAILDRDNHVGGLLMSSFETNLGDWEQRLEKLNVPNVQWDSRRTVGLVLLSVCFAVISLFLPMSAISGPARNRLNVDDQVRRLTSQLDVLKEENILNVEEVEARKLDLERIQKDADGMGPVKTFDALDHIENRMSQQVAEAVEEAQRTTETLAEAESLSQQVKEVSGGLDSTTAKSLMEGLASSLEEMLAQNEKLTQDLKDNLAKKAGEEKKNGGDKNAKKEENGGQNEQEKKDAMLEALKKKLEENDLKGMTPEMLEQLCESMKQCQGDCERMCENLQNAGFPVDQDMLKKLAESKSIEKEEAERMLSDLWANCDGCKGECPGGGERKKAKFSPRFSEKQDWTTDPDEEPDDTRYTKDPDEEGAEFKAKILPPSDIEAFKNSQKIGASLSSPDFDPNAKPGDQGGAVTETSGGTGTAHGQTIYPQHRGTVGRFFGR